MSKWDSEKEELERLINVEKVSYEEIGRRYGCSGANIKKVATKLGIELPQRRKINPCETFDRSSRKIIHHCLNCGKEFEHRSSSYNKFCSNKCQGEFTRKEYIRKWKNGELNINPEKLPNYIKEYLFEKSSYKCEKCGFEGYNIVTHNTILQIHHIDGDASNNSEENLQVLCPNCHAMTENYGNTGNRSSSRKRYDSKEYHFEQFKKEYNIID